jgi:hypothetical protein
MCREIAATGAHLQLDCAQQRPASYQQGAASKCSPPGFLQRLGCRVCEVARDCTVELE